MFYKLLSIIFISALLSISCKKSNDNFATITREGYIDCFPEGVTYDNDRPVSAEISGVLFYHNKIYLANDKRMPGTTSLMTLPYRYPFDEKYIKHIGNEFVKKALKFEDITITPDQKYIFYVTSFDRHRKKTSKWDGYNMLLYAETDSNKEEKVAYPTLRNNFVSSLNLKLMLRKALANIKYQKGPGYFKIEGIAALPGNVLLFGIREMGNTYMDFEYTVKIVGAHYEIFEGKFYFKEDLQVVFDLDTEEYANKYKLKYPFGLSSIEYDPFNKRLLMLTSFEHGIKDTDLGAYLWTLPLNRFLLKEREHRSVFSEKRKKKKNMARKLKALKTFSLETTAELIMESMEDDIPEVYARPLMFAHKAEGITILNKDHVFIIHDDDKVVGRTDTQITNSRTQFRRKINQAAFTIVEFD